jgi:hypothetical protein
MVVVRMKGCYLHNSGKPKGATSENKKGKTNNHILHLQDRLLCLPDSLDTLGETNIIRLKLVETESSKNGSGVESPHGELAGLGDALGGEVVDDA